MAYAGGRRRIHSKLKPLSWATDAPAPAVPKCRPRKSLSRRGPSLWPTAGECGAQERLLAARLDAKEGKEKWTPRWRRRRLLALERLALSGLWVFTPGCHRGLRFGTAFPAEAFCKGCNGEEEDSPPGQGRRRRRTAPQGGRLLTGDEKRGGGAEGGHRRQV